jgi:hypothetical protein
LIACILASSSFWFVKIDARLFLSVFLPPCAEFRLSSSFPSLQAQEDLALRMENAMKLLEQSGQAEPRTIAMILTSAAEGYIERGGCPESGNSRD